MSDAIHLSVVIPAYNEELRIPKTLRSVVDYLSKQSFSWEVLVVDDGSHDKTVDMVRSFMVSESRIKILQYGTNRGKGYAVRYGMMHAKGDYHVFMDADNSTTIDHVERFMPYFREGYDVVIGSRDVDGAEITVHQAKWKETLGDLGNLWIQFWAVPGIKDTQAGFKMFTTKATHAIFPYLTIDRWAFDVEVLAVARERGFKIAERPIHWENDPNSKVSPKAYIEVFKEVVNIRFNIWKGLYNLKP